VTFNPSIPQSTDDISQTQGEILTNFTQLNTIFGNEHVEFNDGTTANRGKHKAIRLIEQASDPSTAADEMALYTKAVSGVTELFTRGEGSGSIWQITGLTPSSATAGSRTILTPFGIRFNFGSVTVSSAGTAITFHTPFASDVFFVLSNQRGGNAEAISVDLITTSGFTATSKTSSLPAYYFAMGI